jgi:hypothetical protein
MFSADEKYKPPVPGLASRGQHPYISLGTAANEFFVSTKEILNNEHFCCKSCLVSRCSDPQIKQRGFGKMLLSPSLHNGRETADIKNSNLSMERIISFFF